MENQQMKVVAGVTIKLDMETNTQIKASMLKFNKDKVPTFLTIEVFSRLGPVFGFNIANVKPKDLIDISEAFTALAAIITEEETEN